MQMTLLVHVQMNGHSAVGAWHVAARTGGIGGPVARCAAARGNGERAPAQWGIMVAGRAGGSDRKITPECLWVFARREAQCRR
jgi:hypothetical protein